MTTALAPSPTLDPTTVQMVLLSGDLARLTPEQRTNYYSAVCRSVGLNPLTQPFEYLKLQGKEKLYARKDATEQLRFIHGVSIDPKGFTREVIDGVYVVTATASMPSGRTDVSLGAVAIEGLKGENKANAMMKAETKAKRRVTLSICGLGMLDETEVDSIPGAQRVPIETAAASVQSGPGASPRAALTSSVTPPPDILTTELPEPGATAPATARRAPSARKPEPREPDSGKSAVTATTAQVIILSTLYVDAKPTPFYEIGVQEVDEQPFEPARTHVLLTADKELYNRAALGEGTGTIFDATWHLSRRPNNEIGKALDALESV
jgi:hypothetical protein